MERKFKTIRRSLAFILLLPGLVLANEKSAKKYTEEEFVKKVSEEVQKKVDQIKNKSVTELTKELIDKEEKLKLRELELVKKEDQLQVNATELEKKVKGFDDQQHKILGCVQKNEDEAKTRISQQVDVISNMKPDKAAQVLTVQDADVAVRILRELDPKKASKIFNFMEKEVSARLQKQYLDMKK
jgi:flagellar motility protein MotE (MotC chaperone)